MKSTESNQEEVLEIWGLAILKKKKKKMETIIFVLKYQTENKLRNKNIDRSEFEESASLKKSIEEEKKWVNWFSLKENLVNKEENNSE